MVEPAHFVQDTLNMIWNHKMVGAIYETFSSGVRLHRSCQEELYGQEALVVDVIERLAAFPDLHLTVGDVIWQSDAPETFRFSVALQFTGHNLGVSRYGPATGQAVEQGVLLHGRVVQGRFVELWQAEDERSLVEQLGYPLLSAMQALEAVDFFAGKPVLMAPPASMGEAQRLGGERWSSARLATLRLAELADLQVILAALWNERQLGLCERFYSDAFSGRWASNRPLENRAAWQALALAQLAAFPDLSFYLDDVIEQRRADVWHVALTWTMLGTHAGPSIYGKPSGQRVQISGISQYHIQAEQWVCERTEWNEFRLMQKIMARPADPVSVI